MLFTSQCVLTSISKYNYFILCCLNGMALSFLISNPIWRCWYQWFSLFFFFHQKKSLCLTALIHTLLLSVSNISHDVVRIYWLFKVCVGCILAYSYCLGAVKSMWLYMWVCVPVAELSWLPVSPGHNGRGCVDPAHRQSPQSRSLLPHTDTALSETLTPLQTPSSSTQHNCIHSILKKRMLTHVCVVVRKT